MEVGEVAARRAALPTSRHSRLLDLLVVGIGVDVHATVRRYQEVASSAPATTISAGQKFTNHVLRETIHQNTPAGEFIVSLHWEHTPLLWEDLSSRRAARSAGALRVRAGALLLPTLLARAALLAQPAFLAALPLTPHQRALEPAQRLDASVVVWEVVEEVRELLDPRQQLAGARRARPAARHGLVARAAAPPQDLR